MNQLVSNGIDVSVTINGRPVRTYSHEGKFFIESREGTEYAIEIKNNNWYRVEAVASVDGLSVVTGTPASIENVGYVIPPRDKVIIKGFRKDHNEVGAFRFTKKESSYAATPEKGMASNVGVIAVAVFAEKQPTYSSYTVPPIPQWVWTDLVKPQDSFIPSGTFYRGVAEPHSFTTCCDSFESKSLGAAVGVSPGSTTAGAAGIGETSRSLNLVAQQVSFDHGTTWGQKLEDKVKMVGFTRDREIFRTEVFYNSIENLKAMGIPVVQEKSIRLPSGFPADFAKPPVGWRG